jgi:hypothetical protein
VFPGLKVLLQQGVLTDLSECGSVAGCQNQPNPKQQKPIDNTAEHFEGACGAGFHDWCQGWLRPLRAISKGLLFKCNTQISLFFSRVEGLVGKMKEAV